MCVLSLGCASRRTALVSNPIFVSANNEEAVWERTVDVLHSYQFRIARENKLNGIIETDYKVGSGLLEPWHRDSRGFVNRLESSLQSIRRRVFISITPAPSAGGMLIGVEAFKELENIVVLTTNTAGAATFQDNKPLQRDLNLVVGEATPYGWIPMGRDVVLENDIVRSLQANFQR